MQAPVRLPRAREARIPTDKLTGYALDPAHERGRHKARVFASALGITTADWRYLHDQILENLPEGEVRGTRITPFGVSYEVLVMIDGLNGATQPVVTTWIIQADQPARLTSNLGGHPVTGCENQPMAAQHNILDVVELLVDSGRWPAGTIGTVVEADERLALVEISDERGHALDFVSLPHDALATRPSHPVARIAS